VFSLCCPSTCNALLGDFVLYLVFRLSSSSKEYLLIRERFLVLNRYCLDIFFMGVRTVDCYQGPAVPPNYSSSGSGPSKLSLRASSASKLFELGLRSLETLSSGQQCLRIIRVRAPVPQISLFGPAVPLYYSSVGSGPSNHLLWASSASELFECGLRSLESLSSGQQCLHIIRVQAPVPRISLFGPAVPLYYSSAGSGPSNLSVEWIPGYPGPPATGPRHRPIFSPRKDQQPKLRRRPSRGGAS
jgi:hypothetical protein